MNGTIYKPAQIVGIYKTIIDRFTTYNPDFIGAKFIYAPLKIKEFNNTVIKEFVDTVQDLVVSYAWFRTKKKEIRIVNELSFFFNPQLSFKCIETGLLKTII